MRNPSTPIRHYNWPHRTIWMALGLIMGLVITNHAVWCCVVMPGYVWLWVKAGRQLYWDCIVLSLLFFLLGTGTGMIQLQQEQYYRALPPGQIQFEGVVVDHRDGSGYLHVRKQSDGTDEQNGKNGTVWQNRKQREVLHVMLSESAEKQHWYPAGTVVEITGFVSLPEPRRNPGGFDEAGWLRGNGIYRIVRAEQISVQRGPSGMRYMMMKIRSQCNAMMQACFSESEQALIQAVLFGEKYRLDDRFYRVTQRLGIAHIFAVSGLHVGFLSGMLFAGLRMFRLEHSIISLPLVGVFLIGYSLLTGSSPSVLRASMMLMLALCGRKLLSPVVGIDYLAFCGVVLLVYQPVLLWTAGFQLSFGVTAALLIFVSPIQHTLEHWGMNRKTASGLSVVMAAWLGSTPVMAGWFYSISLISPIANLLLVPLFSLAVPFVALVLCLGATGIPLWRLFLMPMHLLLQIMAGLPELLDRMLRSTGIPLQWNTGQLPLSVFWIWIVGLFLLWMILQKSAESENATDICKKLLAGCLIGLVVLTLPPKQERNRIIWLYAGQGSSAVVQTVAGEVFIFDGGTSKTELLSVLRWMGINRIHGIILSHGDSDHTAGLFSVEESIPVKNIYGVESELNRLKAEWQEKLPLVKVAKPGVLELKHGRIRMYPVETNKPLADSVQNENGLAAAFETKQYVVAFPGDLNRKQVTDFAHWLPGVTLWTVPHHGSRSSASAELYEILRKKGAEMAVISAGKNNRYGHPHEETVEWIREEGIRCMRTDNVGAITVEL